MAVGHANSSLASLVGHLLLTLRPLLLVALFLALSLHCSLDRLPVGLLVLDTDLTVRRASRRASELSGLPLLPGTPVAELFDVYVPLAPDRRVLQASLLADADEWAAGLGLPILGNVV